MQFNQICVLKCSKCGRLFKTTGGAERHKSKCKMIHPILDGQFSMFEKSEREDRQEQEEDPT